MRMELRREVEAHLHDLDRRDAAPPRGLAARIADFFARHDITVAEVMSALCSAAVCRWLYANPIETLEASPTYAALTTGFADWGWLVYSFSAMALAVMTLVTQSKLLRILCGLIHLSLFVLLAWETRAHAGGAALTADLFLIFVLGSFWSTVRLFARLLG
jgi:hypothetical protein